MTILQMILERGEIELLIARIKKMNFIKREAFGFLFLCIFLSSCFNDQSHNKESDLESRLHVGLGMTEDLRERLGEDKERRGLRDDVWKWIESIEYQAIDNGNYLRLALINLAINYQNELAAAHNPKASKEATRGVISAIDCLYSLTGLELGRRFRDELKSRTFNTNLRQKWRELIVKNFQSETIPRLQNTDPNHLCPFPISG